MPSQLDSLVRLLGVFPVETLYLLVAVGTAVENIFPPIPSDMIVLFGGVLADLGVVRADLVFASAWGANILLALFVYYMGRRYGRAIFGTRWGRWLLRPHQLDRLARFYSDYGTVTILVSRFFPVFRVLIPAFAGISRLGLWRTAIPLAIASAIWYGVLLLVGIYASRNLARVVSAVSAVNVGLIVAAAVLLGGVGFLWWQSRRERRDPP
ncbi:MAG: DedA family protein [Gemmatimonadota bacterium]|jgi:membrane protein DedA with SNARE-associated domain|nr:MAG: DedA family protein [Gemmatimonadota bacterium]